jgi:PAS domain S-box-containing protein
VNRWGDCPVGSTSDRARAYLPTVSIPQPGAREAEGSTPDLDTLILNALCESAPVGFALLDTSLRFQRINHTLAELHGLSVGVHVGRQIFDLLPGLRERAEPALRRVLATGDPIVDLDITWTTPEEAGGRTEVVRGSFFAVSGRSGDPVGVACLVTDITDRQSLERDLFETMTLLDTVLMAAPVGFALIDREHRITRVNTFMVELLAVPADSFIGARIDDLFPDETGELIAGCVDLVLHSGQPVLGYEMSGRNAAGRHVEGVAHYYPVRGADGEVSSVGIITVDVTERNRLERAAKHVLHRYIDVQGAVLDELQHMLFPELPDLAGVTIEARYLAAESVARIGGDWFDGFTLADGRIVLAVGDAVGHGLPAVRTMNLARNLMRGLLVTGASITEALQRTSVALSTDPSGFATAALVVLDERTGTLEVALAGHPPPVIRRADGRVEILEVKPGPPLGPFDGVTYRSTRTTLGANEMVVLYTDGLIERRDGQYLDAGIARLAEGLAMEAGSAREQTGCIIGACLGNEPQDDDACLLLMARAADTPE